MNNSTILKRHRSDRVVTRSCFYAAGVGLIPIPIVDAIFMTSIQVMMVKDIATVYAVPFKKQMVKALIASLIGNLGAVGAVKFIPGLGSTLGAAAVSIGGVAVTFALGQVFSQHFAKGGNLDNFEPDDWRAAFQKVYQKKLQAEQQNTTVDKKAVVKDIKTQANLLHEKQQVLKEELLDIQTALAQLKAKKNKHSFWQRLPLTKQWIIALGVILFLAGLWTFRDTLLPEQLNQTVTAWVDDSVAVVDSLEHEMGIDSLIQEVSEEMDTLVQEVATKIDSLNAQ